MGTVTVECPRRWGVLLVLVILIGSIASAQPGWRDSAREDEGYDGRFRFVRVRWDGGSTFGRRGMNNAWNHDYPRAEANLARILQELTLLNLNPEGRILGLDDPDVFNYPILYMWEPGFWIMTDEQGARFREYLLKGGFAIFDDFEHEQWDNLEAQMRRVLPEGALGTARRVPSRVRFVLSHGAHRLPAPHVRNQADLLRHLRRQ